MGAPKVYRWDDVDAPVLDGQAGSLVNLLDLCLVDGYGTKLPLGWTREFTGVNKRVFRNESVVGTGGFFRFADDESSGYGDSCMVMLYESMTDIDTGVAPTPFTGSGYVHKAKVNNDTAASTWVLIGDDRAFYLFIASDAVAGVTATSYQYQQISFFGDYVSMVPDDVYACGMTVYISRSANYGPALGSMNQVSNKFTMRTSDGAVDSINQWLIQGAELGGTIAGYYGLEHPWNGLTFFSKPLLADGSVAGSFRGYMPGLSYPVHVTPFDNFAEIDVDGANSIAFRFKSYAYPAQVCIDLTASFRP